MTKSETATVMASCDADTELWNSATGKSPAAQSAHFARDDRLIAAHTSAMETASVVNRLSSTMASTSAPN